MADHTDQELVARLRQCDAEAFDEVFAKYRARLYSFLVRLSGRHDVAEDLLQETWIRLAPRVSSLREDSKLAPWLFAVARNLHCSYRRWRLLNTRRLFEFSTFRGDSEPSESPFEAVARDEREKQIERVLASLPLRYREALLLVAVEGLTPSEAAAVCDVDSAALRTRLCRARGLLAAKIRKPSLDSGAGAEPAFVTANSTRRRVAR